MKCSTKGCNNPASGTYLVKTKPKFIKLDDDGEPVFTRSKAFQAAFCSQCGLMAHNKRTYNRVIEDGVERESFPMAFSSVKLLHSFTETEFHKPAKERPEITCYCGHSLGRHDGNCKDCVHCNGFYDGACTNEP
jgi:hypothetical protein